MPNTGATTQVTSIKKAIVGNVSTGNSITDSTLHFHRSSIYKC